MTRRQFEVTMEVTVLVDVDYEKVVDRYVNNEDGIADALYGPMDETGVVGHLAFNRINNGYSSVQSLDWWVDLTYEDGNMRIIDVYSLTTNQVFV